MKEFGLLHVPRTKRNSTFGYAAVGQKIYGALHDGGNDLPIKRLYTGYNLQEPVCMVVKQR